MLIGWDGKVHRVQNYVDRGTFATIELVDVNDVNNNRNWNRYTNRTENQSVNIKSKLGRCRNRNIDSINSTCRATGHDSRHRNRWFNTTNYPNVIYGDPKNRNLSIRSRRTWQRTCVPGVNGPKMEPLE